MVLNKTPVIHWLQDARLPGLAHGPPTERVPTDPKPQAAQLENGKAKILMYVSSQIALFLLISTF